MRFSTVLLCLCIGLITACGGGGGTGGGTSSGDGKIAIITYPVCASGSGSSTNFAGCWIAEGNCQAFTPPVSKSIRALKVRYLAEIRQSGSSATGRINDYFLVYADNDLNCEKPPIDIINMDEYYYDTALAVWGYPVSHTTTYEIIATDHTCDTNITGALAHVPCVALDTYYTHVADAITLDPVLTTSTYYIDSVGQRLCVPIGDYTPGFDLLHYGVLFNSGWSAYRVETFFMTTDDCMSRFTPP